MGEESGETEEERGEGGEIYRETERERERDERELTFHASWWVSI